MTSIGIRDQLLHLKKKMELKFHTLNIIKIVIIKLL